MGHGTVRSRYLLFFQKTGCKFWQVYSHNCDRGGLQDYGLVYRITTQNNPYNEEKKRKERKEQYLHKWGDVAPQLKSHSDIVTNLDFVDWRSFTHGREVHYPIRQRLFIPPVITARDVVTAHAVIRLRVFVTAARFFHHNSCVLRNGSRNVDVGVALKFADGALKLFAAQRLTWSFSRLDVARGKVAVLIEIGL